MRERARDDGESSKKNEIKAGESSSTPPKKKRRNPSLSLPLLLVYHLPLLTLPRMPEALKSPRKCADQRTRARPPAPARVLFALPFRPTPATRGEGCPGDWRRPRLARLHGEFAPAKLTSPRVSPFPAHFLRRGGSREIAEFLFARDD